MGSVDTTLPSIANNNNAVTIFMDLNSPGQFTDDQFEHLGRALSTKKTLNRKATESHAKKHSKIELNASILSISDIELLKHFYTTNITHVIRGSPTLDITIFSALWSPNNFPNLKHIALLQNQLDQLPSDTFKRCNTLTSIIISNSRLKEIPLGLLHDCTELSVFSLESNKLKSIPAGLFNKCSTLAEINLASNRIQEIKGSPFAQTSVKQIDLTKNEISSLDTHLFKGCWSLKELRICQNALSSLENGLFNECPFLELLDLAQNKINCIPELLFSNCSRLSTFKCNLNQIDQLDVETFQQCQNLVDIDLSENQITSLPRGLFSACSAAMKRLDLRSNRLSELPAGLFYLCSQLLELRINVNSLRSLPDGLFDHVTKITELDLSSNEISGAINPGMFIKCVDLKTLNLAHNHLTSLLTSTFKGLNKLISLNVSDNQLVEIHESAFAGCSSLVSIDLSHNQLTCLPDNVFSDLKAVQSINLSNNSLIRLNQSNLLCHCDKLEQIDMSVNKLDIISGDLFTGCKALKTVNMNSNRITKLSSNAFRYNRQLKIALFHDNKIEIVSEILFSSCHDTLETVDLSHNAIKTIHEQTFNKCSGHALGPCVLKELNLSQNKLTEMSERVFDDCAYMHSLDLSSNEIMTIDEGLFKGCSQSLIDLNLSGNLIESLPAELFSRTMSPKKAKTTLSRKPLAKQTSVDLYFDELSTLRLDEQDDSKAFCSLQNLNLSSNKLDQLDPKLLSSCRKLRTINLSENTLSELPEELLSSCSKSLFSMDIASNEIEQIRADTFKGCSKLHSLNFNKNKLVQMPDYLFKDCINLNSIGFSGNDISALGNHAFEGCNQLHDLNLDRNRIATIRFSVLKPLEQTRIINLTGNFSFTSKFLFRKLFVKLPADEIERARLEFYNIKTSVNEDTGIEPFNAKEDAASITTISRSSTYYLCRIDDQETLEKYCLSFFFSKSVKNWSSLFKPESFSQSSFYSKFEGVATNHVTLLDLFLSILGEIDGQKLIGIKSIVDETITNDRNLINKEFLIHSPKSIEFLCEHNVSSLFDILFPNSYQDLISIAANNSLKTKQTKICTASKLICNEMNYFEDFGSFLSHPCEQRHIWTGQVERSVFAEIDYVRCFQMALAKKSVQTAKFVILLLRYFYVMVLSDSGNNTETAVIGRAQLLKFNSSLLENMPYVFEWGLFDIVYFLLDIRKLDQLKKRLLEKGEDFEEAMNF